MDLIINKIDGGITAPEGFFAAGVACGIKKNNAKDLAVICSDSIAVASGVFTTNSVKGHSLQLTMENIKNGYASAVVINSGNANACVGDKGHDDAREMAELTAQLLDCEPANVLIGSTGVIGKLLPMNNIREGIRQAVENVSPDGGNDAARAIMTTDLLCKEVSVEFDIQGSKVKIGGMAKGSGMIHPNMATMICLLTTDVNISKGLLEKALKKSIKKTFNRISVDGDTSVCDMSVILANGEAENPGLIKEDYEFSKFCYALDYVCTKLAKDVARDGEGATRLIEIQVENALTEEDAYKVVCAIAKSPLVKTAVHGSDANWGRVITAAGYSGANINQNLIDIYIGKVLTCKNGTAVEFDEAEAKKMLSAKEVLIKINLKKGTFSDKMWTCDFSENYIKINGNYRT